MWKIEAGHNYFSTSKAFKSNWEILESPMQEQKEVQWVAIVDLTNVEYFKINKKAVKHGFKKQ